MSEGTSVCRRCQAQVINLGTGRSEDLMICSCSPKLPLLEGRCSFCNETTTDGPYMGFSTNPKAAKPVKQIPFCHEKCYYLHILEAEDILDKRLKEKPSDDISKRAFKVFTQLADRICRGEKIPRYRISATKHQQK